MTRTDNGGDTTGGQRRRRNTRDEQLHVGGVRSLDDVTAIYCIYFTLLYSRKKGNFTKLAGQNAHVYVSPRSKLCNVYQKRKEKEKKKEDSVTCFLSCDSNVCFHSL